MPALSVTGREQKGYRSRVIMVSQSCVPRVYGIDCHAPGLFETARALLYTG
jgi:hypothetical protein